MPRLLPARPSIVFDRWLLLAFVGMTIATLSVLGVLLGWWPW